MTSSAERPGPRRGVLVTRPAAEAWQTAERVRALGWEPVVAPLLAVRVRTVRRPARVDAVVVTSGNALAGLAPGGALFAVGDATAARARVAGFGPVHSAAGTAAELETLVRSTCPAGARLLLVTGGGVGMELAAALRAAGFRVVRRTGYVARPVARLPDAARAALAGGGLRAALFLSAETARSFVRVMPPALLPALAGVEALAIGPAAAEELALLPWGRVRVSVRPTLDQVLALL